LLLLNKIIILQTIKSSSYFFSNTALLSNDTGLCDVNNEEFEDICKLTRSKHRKLAYSESCQVGFSTLRFNFSQKRSLKFCKGNCFTHKFGLAAKKDAYGAEFQRKAKV